MTKAIYFLKAIEKDGKLKRMCTVFNVSYRKIKNITDEKTPPSFSTMKALLRIIPINCWFVNATEEMEKKLQA